MSACLAAYAVSVATKVQLKTHPNRIVDVDSLQYIELDNSFSSWEGMLLAGEV